MAESSTVPERPAGGPARGKLRDTTMTLAVLDRVLSRYGTRDFGLRLWDGTTVPLQPGQEARFTLVLNRPGTLRRMMLPPTELSLAESYLDGDWDLEGDVIEGMRLGDAFEKLAMGVADWIGLARQVRMLPNGSSPNGGNGHKDLVSERQRVSLGGAEHSKNRDRKAVTYHYDVGNDFFKLFLDRRMIYSCGFFPTGQEELDAAQEAKLNQVCRKLRLKENERLLDIGCGWGGLLMYAAERFGVEAVGITLSQAQADLANRRIVEAGLSGRCRALVLDYRDVAGHAPFDKIVSVGMVEHVGRAKLPEYFESAWRALKPGGLFLNHGITGVAREGVSSAFLDRYVFHRGAFMRKYVFPDGELIPVGDTLGFAERAGFEVRDVESLREHYALTLRHWVRRLEEHREEAVRQVGERSYRVWRLYMAGCAHAFATARLSVHQSLLSKPDGAGRSHLPWSRADLHTDHPSPPAPRQQSPGSAPLASVGYPSGAVVDNSG